jgi:hypothetical protein
MICRSDGAYRNFFRGNYKDLAPTEHALALEMSKLHTDAARPLEGVRCCRCAIKDERYT